MNVLIEVAQSNITPPFVSLNGYIEMTCPKPDGITHIRKALQKAQKVDDERVIIQYIGAPLYRLKIVAPDYKMAEDIFKKTGETAVSYISSKGGAGSFRRED